MPRIVGYIRVSSEMQTDNYSLAAQRHAITQYCAAHGWAVAAWYEDAGVSAHKETITARPAFATLLADAETHQFDQVIVHKLDRFSRRLAVTLEALARLERVGVGFVSITENLDFASPIGKVALAMLGALAQYHSDNLSTETRKGLAEKKRQGLHIGAIPFGAMRTNGRLSVDPALADTLRDLYALMADHSDYEVAQEFNRRSIPTRFAGVAWSDNAIRAMRLTHGAWLLDQPDPWPDCYRAARDRATRPRTRAAATTYMLTGLLKCRCGGWIRLNSRKAATRYGTCIQHGRVNTRCDRWRGLNITRCEVAVRAWLLALPDPTLVTARPVADGDERRAALTERRRRLARLYADGLLSDAEYQSERVRLTADEARLPASQQQIVTLGTRFAAVQASWDTLPPEAQNEFLRHLLWGVEVGDGAVIPRLQPAWAMLWPDQPSGPPDDRPPETHWGRERDPRD